MAALDAVDGQESEYVGTGDHEHDLVVLERPRRGIYGLARGGRWAIAIGGLAASLALVYLSLALTDTSAAARVPIFLVGLILLRMLVIYNVGDLLWGPRWDAQFWLAIGWFALLGAAAIAVSWLPVSEAVRPENALLEPALARPDLLSSHPLGTDQNGLDILGQLLYGARVSLRVGLTAALIGAVVGGLIGTLAGYYAGRIDGIIGTLVDIALAFPAIILLLVIATLVTPSVWSISFALAFLAVPSLLRISRAHALTLSQREFVVAARALGEKDRSIILRELAPNIAIPLIGYLPLVVASLVVAEASLSYLGFGIVRPNPTWGNMIAAGQGALETDPHLVLIPAVMLFITVYCLNIVGERARVTLDPRDSLV